MAKNMMQTLLLLAFALLFCRPAAAQSLQASTLWLRVWGDAGAVEEMTFGNTTVNTAGMDTTAPGDYRESEAPPPSPTLDCVWHIPPGCCYPYPQFPYRLQPKDLRQTLGGTYDPRVDTFAISFWQNDNSSATISFRWPGAASILAACDSLILLDLSGALDFPGDRLDMTTTDTLSVPAAGDNLVNVFRIFRYGVKLEPTDAVQEDKRPARFLLSSNYPNPFNPSTRIEVETPRRGWAVLEVFDLLGRSVATLFNGELEAGKHGFVWEAGERAGGVYICRLSADGMAETRTMVLLR